MVRMVGISSLMSLFLLQWRVDSVFKEDNPLEAMILLVVIGVVIVFSIAISIVRRVVRGAPAPGSKTGSGSSRRFSIFALRRIATAYGLDKEQTRLLEYVFRTDQVIDPERAISNPALLDRIFKRAYKTIERNSETEDDAQQRMVKLFTLRNLIEASTVPGSVTPSQLAPNTPAVLVIDNENYPVKVLFSRDRKSVV